MVGRGSEAAGRALGAGLIRIVPKSEMLLIVFNNFVSLFYT